MTKQRLTKEESFRDMDLKIADGELNREVTKGGMEVLEAASDGTVLATHSNVMGLLLIRLDGM